MPWEFSEATAAWFSQSLLPQLLMACYQDGLLMLWACYRLSGGHKAMETVQFSSVQSLSHVRLFATPWTAAHQASQSPPKLMSVEFVMPSNHLIFCRLLLLPPSISIRVFSNESVLHVRWPKDWSFTFSISSPN